MPMKLIACLLVWTVTLLTLPPAKTFAQTRANLNDDQDLFEPLTRTTPDLKATFATEVSRIKAGTLTKADFERMRQTNQNPKPPSSFTRRQKIFLALWIVIMAGVVAVLIKHPCREKKPGDCDFIDDSSSY